MAETHTAKSQPSGSQSLARHERSSQPVQRSASPSASPFDLMNRMSAEMDRLFDDFGLFPRGSWWRSFPSVRQRSGTWAPRVEAFQKGDQFIVRAELPGLKKDDVQVELTDEAVTIHGERREDHREEREGYFHSERQYGEFYRRIPLPEGVIGESAQASFRDGVLEVTMKAAPAEANRGRRLEIREGAESKASEPKK